MVVRREPPTLCGLVFLSVLAACTGTVTRDDRAPDPSLDPGSHAGRGGADGAGSGGDGAGNDAGTNVGGQGGASGAAGMEAGSGAAGSAGMVDDPEPPALRCDYPAFLSEEAIAALESGDARTVESAATLIDDTRAMLEAQRTAFDEDLIQLFELNADGTPNDDSLQAIDWDPRHDAGLLGSRLGSNVEALITNDTAPGRRPR